MTNRTPDQIRSEIAANSTALQQAIADAALYERLRLAPASVPALRKDGDKLLAELQKAEQAEARAAVAQFEAGNRNFRIDRVMHDQRTGLSHDRFVISWDRLCYDMNAHENVWQDHKVDGFDLLPDDVMQYLLERKTTLIPSDILALVPGDPFAAMGRYLTGRGRNHF